jgi:hypothetical protein
MALLRRAARAAARQGDDGRLSERAGSDSGTDWRTADRPGAVHADHDDVCQRSRRRKVPRLRDRPPHSGCGAGPSGEEFVLDHVSVISDPCCEAADCEAEIIFSDNARPASRRSVLFSPTRLT